LHCRLSDDAAFLYSLPADSIGLGRIARTLPGSTTVEDAGWTTGTIQNACSLVELERSDGQRIRVYCAHRADYYSLGQDSGAPVFTLYNGDAAIAGTHMGRNQFLGQWRRWFTHYGHIESELGVMQVWADVPPPPFSVEIDGPDQVPPNAAEGCAWTALVNGASNPTYGWDWDGQLVGTWDTYVPSGGLTQGAHWLTLEVTDGGATGVDSLQVYVDSQYSCPW